MSFQIHKKLSWGDIAGAPDFLRKDVANTPGQAVVLDATGKIPSDLLTGDDYLLNGGTKLVEFPANISSAYTYAVTGSASLMTYCYLNVGEKRVLTKVESLKQAGIYYYSTGLLQAYPGFLAYKELEGTVEAVTDLRLQVTPYTSSVLGTVFNLDKFVSLSRISLHGLNFESTQLPNTLQFIYIYGFGHDVTIENKPDLEYLYCYYGFLRTLGLSNCPKLNTLVARELKPGNIIWTDLLKLRRIYFDQSNALTQAELESIIQGLYDLEQVRIPVSSCLAYLTGDNATPNANTITMMDWLRSNKGWTILHN